MFSDYRAFGLTDSTILSTGTITADSASKGFVHVAALADTVLANVILRYPRAGTTPNTDVTLKAGQQLTSLASFSITSGQVHVFFFRG